MPKQLDLTTFLDLVGLALVCAGLGVGLWPLIGGFALVCAGIVLVAGSVVASKT